MFNFGLVVIRCCLIFRWRFNFISIKKSIIGIVTEANSFQIPESIQLSNLEIRNTPWLLFYGTFNIQHTFYFIRNCELRLQVENILNRMRFFFISAL